ncbi:MAG: methyltransferase domain-containing protein [Nitrosopumilaceae archaeon]|nr:methyltransferase domain-containing protein [Nitrosopumilaceae archaeon]NIU00065.1 methyltransferase domain-containing protein [Nitrosopumilaceae archaeon]NIU86444.1 methyltransferase domain-containing protein [Nitrosopumilaceae archaeon]NIV65153.1 methyltransferase domain-containing protein [Nitrosopumilaceae archaeon]NIX60667.1 methyltransferase domain-containing protein [Nitrosopumilaceae archaeon]
MEPTKSTKAAGDYYDSTDADNFYATIWGGNDIHVGLYSSETEPIPDASARTVETIVSRLKPLNEDSEVIDIGAGYGGAARYMAKKFGCKVVCLNLGERQNERNEKLNKEQGLDDKIKVVQGNFEKIPFEDNSFDVVYSQDAIVHSGNRRQVIKEVSRVLKDKGEFVFTDFLQKPDCPKETLEPILRRIRLDSIESLDSYRKMATDNNLKEVEFIDYTNQFTRHYTRVREETQKKYDELLKVCSQKYIDEMIKGLDHWINGGQKRDLQWGIMHFEVTIPSDMWVTETAKERKSVSH